MIEMIKNKLKKPKKHIVQYRREPDEKMNIEGQTQNLDTTMSGPGMSRRN